MKKTLSLLLFAALFCLSACGHGQNSSAETVNRTYKLSDAVSIGSNGAAEPKDEEVPAPTSPLLYCPDSTGQYIVSRELSDLSLRDPTLDVQLVKALADNGILNRDVALNSISFDLSEDKKQELVLLDFTTPFQTQVSGCTPEQERMLMGCLVNTFLSAYDRELATVTVEGKRLVSPNEYSYRNPVPWYSACDEEPFTKTVRQDGVRLKLSLERIYSEAGFLIEQDTEHFTYRYDAATHTASFYAPDTRHRDETPAFLRIATAGETKTAALGEARKRLEGKPAETAEKLGVNQVDATCLSVSDEKGGQACWVFVDGGRVWLAETHWNKGEESTRLARMNYMLSTFQAIS